MDLESRKAELKIIGVGDMLQDIAKGLGPAHHTLWQTSRTPVGTLAVKDVGVKIEFEMSSNGSRQGVNVDLPTLGAKTFSFGAGTTSEESRQSNRTTLTLNVVNVMPDKEDAELLKLMLLGVTTGIGQLKLTKDQQTQLSEAVVKINDLIHAGDLLKARAALDNLIALYEQLKAPQPLKSGSAIKPPQF